MKTSKQTNISTLHINVLIRLLKRIRKLKPVMVTNKTVIKTPAKPGLFTITIILVALFFMNASFGDATSLTAFSPSFYTACIAEAFTMNGAGSIPFVVSSMLSFCLSLSVVSFRFFLNKI